MEYVIIKGLKVFKNKRKQLVYRFYSEEVLSKEAYHMRPLRDVPRQSWSHSWD